jgi:RAB protein geranylgeranyltransferase component A
VAETPSNLFRLADTLLKGTTLREFVLQRRLKQQSWRVISRDLFNATGVDVSDVSLRKWFVAEDAESVA